MLNYKQQQMTGIGLQLLAAVAFYGMQSTETKTQHDIAFGIGCASLYFGTIIRINSFDKFNKDKNI